jgi:hypothetical protein
MWLLERKRIYSNTKRSFYRNKELPRLTTSFRASPNQKLA